MDDFIAIAVLAGLGALLIASLWALVSPPHPVTLALAGVAFGTFTWQVFAHWRAHVRCERILSMSRRHDFETRGAGERVLRLEPLPGVRGIGIRVERNSGGRPDYATLTSCGWKARGARGPVQISGSSMHGLVDIEEEVAWIELFYSVDDTTRPLLSAHHLKIMVPYMTWKGSFVYRDVCRIAIYVFAGAALLALAGVVIQAIRLERRRRQRASQAA